MTHRPSGTPRAEQEPVAADLKFLESSTKPSVKREQVVELELSGYLR